MLERRLKALQLFFETVPVDSGMALIPGGRYPLGSDHGPPSSRPAHSVELEPFGLDLLEVSTRDYAGFVREGRAPAPWNSLPDSSLPVIRVTHGEAMAFCRWKHPPEGRLPTEAE